jgi:hypothetical protein
VNARISGIAIAAALVLVIAASSDDVDRLSHEEYFRSVEDAEVSDEQFGLTELTDR